MKISYQGLEFEFEVIPFLVSAANHFSFFRKNTLLGKFKEPISLISSNLFAIQGGTTIKASGGEFRAAPLLKPRPDGTAVPINSGFPVTGIYDSFGQVEVGTALGTLKLSFKIFDDMDPKLDKNENLICFGSPSSNLLSGHVFDNLQSVLNEHFDWGDGHNSFTIGGELLNSGDDGIILFHDSPWNQDRKILVLAGLGPMGTLASCKIAAGWNKYTVSGKQKKSKNFIASVKYNRFDKDFKEPLLKRFIKLD